MTTRDDRPDPHTEALLAALRRLLRDLDRYAYTPAGWAEPIAGIAVRVDGRTGFGASDLEIDLLAHLQAEIPALAPYLD